MATPKPITPPQGVSKTNQTSGKMGTKMATLGPTLVGIHGPDGIHQRIKSSTSARRPVTPNTHAAQSMTPAVGVRNTPTKGKK